MLRKSQPLEGGDVFEVPLSSGRCALGVIARPGAYGYALGYFYGPFVRPSELRIPPDELTPTAANYVSLFSDLELEERTWPIRGKIPEWNPLDWPVPEFGYVDRMSSSTAFARQYHDPTLGLLGDRRVSPDEARKMPEDGYPGGNALRIKLCDAFGIARPNVPAFDPNAFFSDWGYSPFDWDTATDWLADFTERPELDTLIQVFTSVEGMQGQYIDRELAEQALVAAEVTSALFGKPHSKVPREVTRWVKQQSEAPSPDLLMSARNAVSRVLKDSELRESWIKPEDLRKWEEETNGLLSRLG